MNETLRSVYTTEVRTASAAVARGDTEAAFGHLGRAHILSQRHTWQHIQVHMLMLKLGASIGDWRETFGQISRVFAAAIFSRIWVPVGNTGRANVSALQPMAIPEDLRAVMERSIQPGLISPARAARTNDRQAQD